MRNDDLRTAAAGMRRPLEGLAETVEIQNTIIKLQSGVINELFILLMEHIEAKEADKLPCVQKINEAARLRARFKLEEGETDYG